MGDEDLEEIYALNKTKIESLTSFQILKACAGPLFGLFVFWSLFIIGEQVSRA